VAGLLRDARFGLRLLLKSPSFSAVAVLTLAVGISATTTVFSVVHAVFLAPLPYREPDRLVMVFTRMDGARFLSDAGDYARWKGHAAAFEDLQAWTLRSVNLAVDERPAHVEAGVATPGLLALIGLGHPLALGRDFLAEEGTVGREQVAILSHRLWQERFGGDRRIVGRAIRIDGKPHTVVGVLGEGAADRHQARLWMPLAPTPEQLGAEVPDLRHYVAGRLRSGLTVEQAHASMDALTRRLAEAAPARAKGRTASVEPVRNSLLAGDTKTAIRLLFGAVALVLLIACANVANLHLARATARRRELALRTSLGASRSALVRQLLTESLLLALAGGGLGIVLALPLLRTFVALLPAGALPVEADVRLSVPVLLFTLAVCVLCALLFGCAPAWRASRVDANDALKAAAPSLDPGRDRLRRALVIGECALALTLLAAGGLVVRGLVELARVDLGFRTERLLTFSLPVPEERLAGTERIVAFYREMAGRLESIPGVQSVSISATLPMHAFGFAVMTFDVVGAPAEDPSKRRRARLNVASPGYFATFGIPLARGRPLGEQDRAGAFPAAVVNEAFVEEFLPHGDPLEQRLAMKQLLPGGELGPLVEWRVVGVSRDVRNADPRSRPVPEITLPFAQNPWPAATVALRTAGDPGSVPPSAAAAIRALDPDLPMADLRTMAQVVAGTTADDRLNGALFGGFALVALLLAAGGVYGVLSFVVAQRTREIGLRMALGAGRGRILRDVVREGMGAALLGTALGSVGAWLAARTLRGLVYGAGIMDLGLFVVVALILLAAALLACAVPARRAAAVDPMAALRQE
jgi:putative ABC transport system permease protein